MGAVGVKELAEEHADFYMGKGSRQLGARWVETVWSPDIEIRISAFDGVRTRDDWVASHAPAPSPGSSASNDRQVSRTRIDRIHVAEDSFVLQGSVTGPDGAPVPLCLVFEVRDGMCVTMYEYLDVNRLLAAQG
jgi:hypothetical protein